MHGDLPGERAAVSGNQHDRDPDPCSENRQDDAVGGAIVAVDHGNGEQGKTRLHEQHGPLHPVDRRSTENDALPACLQRILEGCDDLALGGDLACAFEG